MLDEVEDREVKKSMEPKIFAGPHFSGEAVYYCFKGKCNKGHIHPVNGSQGGAYVPIVVKGFFDIVPGDTLKKRRGFNLYIFQFPTWLTNVELLVMSLIFSTVWLILDGLYFRELSDLDSIVLTGLWLLCLFFLGIYFAEIVGGTLLRWRKLRKLRRLSKMSLAEKREREHEMTVFYALLWDEGFCSGQPVWIVYRGVKIRAYINPRRYQPGLKGYVPVISWGKRLMINVKDVSKRRGINWFVFSLPLCLQRPASGLFLWTLFAFSTYAWFFPLTHIWIWMLLMSARIFSIIFLLCIVLYMVNRYISLKMARKTGYGQPPTRDVMEESFT